MFRLLLLVWLVLVADSVWAAELPTDAVKAIEIQNWQGLSDALTSRIKDKSDEPAQYWHAVAQFELGNFSIAVTHLNNALKANPTSVETGVYLARCALALNKPEIADAALEVFPANSEIALLVGRVWLNLYYPEAAKDRRWKWNDAEFMANATRLLERAAALDPDSADAQQWLAAALFEAGEYRRALKHVERAAFIGSARWELYALIGECLKAMGQDARAAQAYKIAAQLAPAIAPAIDMERGKALCRSWQYVESVEIFRKILKNDIGHRTIRYWLGRAAFGAGDYQLAMWAFVECREVDHMFEALVWAGRCALELGEYADAQRLIQQGIDEANEKIENFSVPAMYLGELGLAQWYNGQQEAGIKNLVKAVKEDPPNLEYAEPAILFYLDTLKNHLGAIDVLRSIGTHGHAEDAIEGITELMHDFPDRRTRITAYAALAAIYGSEGKFHTALHYYKLAGQAFGPRAKTLAGWVAIHAGDLRIAGLAFSSYFRFTSEENRDFGRYGLAYTRLAEGNPQFAKMIFSKITRESMLDSRDAGLLWAAVALKDGSAEKLANPYTLLGMIDNGFAGSGEDRGYEIIAIIPGTPLDNTSPGLRAMDVILKVGDVRLNSNEANETFRKSDIPKESVTALVRRGDYIFEVEIDYPGAMKKLPKPSAEDTP